MNEEIDFQSIDKKQQERWEKDQVFKSPRLPRAGKKFYCLDMFPYPSGAGLHVGHPEGYTASDILVRYKRMNDFDVVHPMGWDAFGLPAENYAIATGVHPKITTEKNIDTYRRQIKAIGLAYDWDREINTTDPKYYKWTQWIFLQLFKKGLAYESYVPINWCSSCKTGLANEEVYNGKCERCGTVIERKNLRQWMLKITEYAERLLEDLDGLDWPESTLAMQKNWIGKSEGAEVRFDIEGHEESVTVFTTRPDTLYGATYMVLAPEHPLINKITTPAQKEAVNKYIEEAAKKSDFERGELNKTKTGVFTGAYAVNPVNNKLTPVWISDYVLMSYGTGAIMAVPAHDQRDYEFAQKFGLEIIEVISSEEGVAECAYKGGGLLKNSGIIDGLDVEAAKGKIIKFLEEKGAGKKKTTYRLRDWVFSRQRYWGEPIPIVHCPKCGAMPLEDKDLPLTLPEVTKFEPTGTGESPLAAVEEWINTTCPKCGGKAKRETNTMPQWAGSCWYYLRYLAPHNDKAFIDPEIEKAWNPVDFYIGGAEHAVLHLLYSRFWHKVLYDLGHVSHKEPFQKLRHQGMILAYSYRDENGVYHGYEEVNEGNPPTLKESGAALKSVVEKMSKSKKNVVNPDDILARYGADAFRMYEMFMGPFEDSKPWDMKGIEGISRFLKRFYAWGRALAPSGADGKDVLVLRNKTVAKAGEDILSFSFNTAISAMMILFNDLSKREAVSEETFKIFLQILHPFAPHITEELWQQKNYGGYILHTAWPQVDASLLQEETLDIGVQVNGRLRGRVTVPASAAAGEIEKLALAEPNVAKHLEGKTVVKVIVVPKKMVSIVVK